MTMVTPGRGAGGDATGFAAPTPPVLAVPSLATSTATGHAPQADRLQECPRQNVAPGGI